MRIKTIIAILLLITATHCAQNYISDEGTTADSFRIGNTRYFTFKLDNDSNFVEMTINGVWKRIADWQWVRKFGIDTTKKWIWLNEHNFKKVVKIDSLFKFGNNGRLELPTYAVMPREIYFDDNDVKYISEDSTEILVNRSYLITVLDSLLMDSVFVKSAPFIYVQNGYLLKFQGNSGLYLPNYLNDEGMIGHNGNFVLFYNNLGNIDSLASTEWVRNYIDSLPGGTGSYTFAPPLWNIGGQIQLDVASPLFLEENDHLAIKKASATQDGYLSKEDFQTFYSGSSITMQAVKDTIWFNYIQDILSDIVGIDSALVAFSISGSGRNVHWNNVTNKPSSFPTSGYTGQIWYLNETGEDMYMTVSDGLIISNQAGNELNFYNMITGLLGDVNSLAGNLEDIYNILTLLDQRISALENP